jgi:multidrug efflux pump subunit AcrA (membrane-fusion protein)
MAATPGRAADPPGNLKLPGRVEAAEQAELYSRIVGYVQRINVDIGDRVRKGQLLAELAVPEMEADLRRKEALLVQADAEIQHAEQLVQEARATLAGADAEVRQSELGVKQAQARLQFAQTQLARFKTLFENKSIDGSVVEEKEQQLEAVKAELALAEVKVRVAQATRESVTANRGSAEAGVKVAVARRDAARADAERQRVMVQYARILAPFDGVVTRRNVHVGDLAGPPNPRGQPLFTVARVDMVRVIVAIPDADVARMQVGTPAVVEINALPGLKFTGAVSRMAAVLDDRDRTLRAEIDLANTDGKLLPGMFATVTLTPKKD